MSANLEGEKRFKDGKHYWGSLFSVLKELESAPFRICHRDFAIFPRESGHLLIEYEEELCS